MSGLSPPNGIQLVQLLGSANWADRERAANSLASRGADAAPDLVKGMAHSDWRVRAQCAALMDHLANEACLEALLAALHDTSPHVRRHAVHSLGCQKCKRHSLPVDVVSHLIERALEDDSIRVRRVAVHQLGLQPHDPRAVKALTAILQSVTDQKLLSRAAFAMQNHLTL